MNLASGSQVGPYKVVSAIGAGGMGEVYRARDTRLDRDVAIKILPGLFSADPERLARFEREAKTLASLNHPNIAQIYGIESVTDPTGNNQPGRISALVMELVDGEDLSARIARAAIPLDEALPIARQIADALEAAHERGIIHRDLKPANIKLRDDGTVKVLDFGLAKALDPAGRDSGAGFSDPVNSPTITSPATHIGMILGTAAYMAPEQAKGRIVDKRADIWAFGAVLYEMLTGRRAFDGEDVSTTMAAVLMRDPDWNALPPDTPPAIRRVLRRCLQKDPRKRLSAIGDARLELEESTLEPHVSPQHTGRRPGWQLALMWAAAGAVAALGIGAVGALWRSPTAAPQVVRSEISVGETGLRLPVNRAVAIDPSGSEIVFSGQGRGQFQGLYRRRLSEETAVEIGGTDGASGVSFSPDGKWLVFAQQGRLKKIPAAGGGAIDLGEAEGAAGVGFMPDGSFILNPFHGGGLFRVAADGSARTPLTTVDHERGEAGHHWPHVLPDGKSVLFTVELDGKSYSDARIEMLSLATGERRVLIEGGTDARYVSTGHLLYCREQDLWQRPFDLASGQITGPATMALRNVMMMEPNGVTQFAVAGNGTLVYVAGRDPREERSLVLVNRAGVARQLTTEGRAFEQVTVSPDGRRVATTILAANDSLWTLQMGRSSLTRITYEAENSTPVWSFDGARLAFSRYRGGEAATMFMVPADGSASPERIRDSGGVREGPESWSRNGQLAFVRFEPAGPDIWTMEAGGDRKARPFLPTRFVEAQPRFSPDGKWIAYTSDESGRAEVYVRPYPGPGQKQLVSSDGGSEPRWRADSREIFYRKDGDVMAVAVTPGPALDFGQPRTLFSGRYVGPGVTSSTWDVMPDGQGFILIQNYAQPRASVSLVQNWFEQLRKK